MSNDQAVEFTAVPRSREIYDPNRALSVRPTDAPLKLTTSSISQVDLPTLPTGIAAGTYQVVNHFGDVKTLTITVSDPGLKSTAAPQDCMSTLKMPVVGTSFGWMKSQSTERERPRHPMVPF